MPGTSIPPAPSGDESEPLSDARELWSPEQQSLVNRKRTEEDPDAEEATDPSKD